MPVDVLRVPDDFWSRDQVQTALRARDVGRLFLLLRQYAGASQTQIGAAVGMAQGYVSKVMTGHCVVSTIDLLERIAEGLCMPARVRALFGLAPAREAPERTSHSAAMDAAPGGQAQSSEAALPTFGRRLGELRRQRGLSFRRLGRQIHYSHGYLWELETGSKRPTPDVASALDRALDADGQLLAIAKATSDIPPAAPGIDEEAETEPWSIAEAIGRSSMPLSMVERMERLAFAQVTRYPHTAPCHMWPVVTRELARVRRALAQRQALSVQLRLTKVAGVLAGVAGNLSTDVGRRDTALEYFDLSQLAGRESGDWDLTAWAIALESIDSFFSGHIEQAAGLLDQATAFSDHGSSVRRRAWIAALRARAYAAKHDSAHARTALDHATRLMEKADTPGGSDFFDQERLDGIAGTTYLLLGDTDGALELIDSALDRRSPYDVKGRALLTLDKAECRVRVNEREGAFEAINTALDLGQDQFVQPILARAREVISGMSRWPTTAASRAVHQRLEDLGG